MQTYDISVVVPVYKADGCIAELIHRLTRALFNITDNYEIILVEDCGRDMSWELIEKYAKDNPRIKGIKFSRNFGQHYGITAGLDYSSGRHVVVMDCDLQDRPEDINSLYKKALEGFDIVLGRRGVRAHSKIKILGSKAFYKVFSWMSGMKYDPQVGNFRVMSRSAVNNFCSMRENLRFFGGLVEWMGYSSAYVDITHDERFSGISSYNFRKLISLAASAIIAYSDKPLILSIKLGFTIAFLAILSAAYLLYRSIVYGVAVQGWASITISIYFVGGVTIGVIGILGIYIGQIFDEVKKRPLYIVEKSIGVFGD